ncbi:TPA: bacteriocin-associated integral membrane family protein [Streptococcus suis]|nr:bacteriocin-associated integral membrane family protein [Streptococcus suis]HEM6056455.1 bacteriocin-associated integral membrane family protein [Streptococcus suis]HEM6133078.1 bacteriocin-associated integral membrane family protein [Streptococcus suis]HEM6149969.1 bacteriocin-associated integral membrane family protein [Streptococcus suis]HEM6159748.1 bacteriocin-associated integral membrane family protein [Streptococcus suis]
MKRIFVILSNILLSIFLVWVLSVWKETYVSYYYPNVAVLSSSQEVSFESVAKDLGKLAEESDSLIAVQHQTAGADGTSVFSYTPLGEGELPKGLTESPLVESTEKSPVTNYFIFRGSLNIESLRNELSQLGLTNLHIIRPSMVTNLIALFGNGFQLVCLVIFLLTFASLSVIGQIRTLRTAGIRLISGENRWKIFLRVFAEDIGNAGLGFICGLLIAYALRVYIPYPFIAFSTILMGLGLYNLIILLLSLCFVSLFAVGIKKIHLMQVIKGQIPVRGIISLILVGQLLAIIIVSIGTNKAMVYSRAWQQQEQGREAWQAEKQVIAISTSRDGFELGMGKEEARKKQNIWFQLVHQTVSEGSGFMVYHQLIEKVMQNGMDSSENLSSSPVWRNYEPNGNVLFVTPNYLKHQQIRVAPEIEEKINRLETGEFILLLPEFLRSEEGDYKTKFEEDVSNRMADSDQGQQMVATVSYLEEGKNRFVYNTTPISYQQFLRDPILVVLTPKSTGEQAVDFWEQAISHYFFFENLEEAKNLVEVNGIENWVSEYLPAYQIHQTLLKNIQREVWTTVAGAILGILTSILLFNTMNELYFEEFRRDIFIKRIAGLGFFAIHRTYLIAQLGVFLLAFMASSFLVRSISLAFCVLLLFVGLSVFRLQMQMKKEMQTSMFVLKGA